MEISILGPMRAKPMKIKGHILITEFRLQSYLEIDNWEDFIEYVKKYKNKGERKM